MSDYITLTHTLVHTQQSVPRIDVNVSWAMESYIVLGYYQYQCRALNDQQQQQQQQQSFAVSSAQLC